MDVLSRLNIVRLAALADSNAEDARLWRWFANALEEGRLFWHRDRKSWEIYLHRALVAKNASFDVAMRCAYEKSLELDALEEENAA
jgi:hypothetical protein